VLPVRETPEALPEVATQGVPVRAVQVVADPTPLPGARTS
jgi:hypothetical protein